MTAASTDLAHEGPGFPTWHRRYLLLFEELAQKVSDDPTFALPYVNEYDATAISRTVDLLGGDGLNIASCHVEDAHGKNCACHLAANGPGSVFSSWTEIGPNGTSSGKLSRALGCRRTAQTPPSATAIDFAIATRSYSESPWNSDSSLVTFTNLLEGFAIGPVGIRTEPAIDKPRDNHNRVHVYMGGTMDDVKTAASDPFFWLHHGFVDLMLEKWMKTHPTSVYPWTNSEAPAGHSYSDCQAPFVPLLSHAIFFSNSRAYGYTYDQIVDSAVVSTGSLVVITIVMTALVITASLLYS
ncbi:unnamed protein product [Didymodactylos carnosus]|uniref:Tyrosinase copper-binding domain-containing protein n=1 Tax=Didymodactylos carnosus TaxID=1234261 RepID=A0A814TH65_9BILA|nr:unnamed protein product [Didymodactylos carnosus]CAF1160750.1 unnamed protein product [Didymodactylos carnosus]CAF3672047.1 unnamed protein product [Didymodactylos carnosus]CAF3924312.1 unnamed protein product [Didymodactylos carnosus]